MHIHYFQHVPFEGLASIADWIARTGHTTSHTRWYDDDPDTSGLEEADLLLIVGGTMGVYEQDRYPWMQTELDLIRKAIGRGQKILGICLGAQLLAYALGANVYPHTQPEIGWFPIDITFQEQAAPLENVLPHRLNTFHFHGDTFDVPPGATRFAASAACSNQAYIYGDRIIGLQFHMEMNSNAILEILRCNSGAFANEAPFVQSPEKIEQYLYLANENNQTMFRLLDYLAGL
ncbi:type 1 glutamine amidotransferase [Chitinophaga qingshengii]|uniref:Gamma-glutamyl-gamma-aminobutyrate hydrolase family protein n=1 Tax=Chitinophaga qingshengii TaxID=1569794 RepID=A0ABR7TKC5_9BACT|nr:gamma-glutamyl-gamma-aminobutyrate hydrolase family protein [Chitinophaga qingshengii]MBC9930435.1 gamma-glutamyl-gamma-aminobutyrate hydrolase family protein [Chitinophaga qingshengii]